MNDVWSEASNVLASEYAGPNVSLASDFLDILMEVGMGILGDFLGKCSFGDIFNTVERFPLRAEILTRLAVVDRLRDSYGFGVRHRFDVKKMAKSYLSTAKKLGQEKIAMLVR